MTGRRGYFGKESSVVERLQRKNVEPRLEWITRLCRQLEHKPAGLWSRSRLFFTCKSDSMLISPTTPSGAATQTLNSKHSGVESRDPKSVEADYGEIDRMFN